jgi:predicted Rossmann-fold nucleotide-binding protein
MKTDYADQIQVFLESLRSQGIEKIIAFSGSCSTELEADAERIVEESFEVYRGLPIAIQTGGTEFDIQKFAAARAKKEGMPLIGIYPSRGVRYRLSDLDFALEVGPRLGQSSWGDESEIFAKLPNAVELIGGGIGTLIEFGHLMKYNEGLLKNRREPVYIAPVRFPEQFTTAYVADNFALQDSSREKYGDVFPGFSIFGNGTIAAKYICSRLGLLNRES